MNLVKQFNDYRSKMNEKILASDNLIIKRIFNLDTNAYANGVLDIKSKELIGLTCSLVLRCDVCVKYHLGKCKEVGFTTAEVHEAMGVATLVGGTIVIPHLRRAYEFWEELNA
ncbi:MAG: carboxymuconolactone decarboxylase family protein [Bacteroidota bacterium]|mgnify:CR=1 FL=1